MARGEQLPLVRTFGQLQPKHCIYGYSLDGHPNGEIDFEEECLADGNLSHTRHCEDIDYCIGHRCGDHGQCTDDLLQYHCSCDAGYEVAMLDGSSETCRQIDECAIHGGHDYWPGTTRSSEFLTSRPSRDDSRIDSRDDPRTFSRGSRTSSSRT